MKFLGAVLILLVMAALMTGAGGGSGATYVDHDKVTATLAKGGPLAKGANYTVGTNFRTMGGAPEIHEKTMHIWYVLDGSATYVTGGTLMGGKVTKPGLTQGTNIEGGQTESQIQDLVDAAAGAQSQYPNLQFSFTLATLAASDGSYGGVNSLGNEVVEAVLGSSLKNYVINLMTMDYGSASSSVCVVVSGSCEMGQSAIQAVKSLEHTYGIPASKIAVTPMIGLNDNTSETFTPADVDTLTTYAASNGLAGLHLWSLDRDTPCATTTTYASPTCNSDSGTTPLEFDNRFLSDLGK